MKKILVIHTKYRNLGGEDIAVDNEVNFLKNFYDVKTIYFSNTLTKYFTQIVAFITNSNKSSLDLLKEQLESFQPDIVYVHNTWFKASLGIFNVLHNYDTKVVLKLHNLRYDCTQSIFSYKHFSDTDTCKACGRTKKRFSILNTYFEGELLKSLIVLWYGKKYIDILRNNNIKILVLTKFHLKKLLELGINREKIEIFPNYVNNGGIADNKENSKNYIVYAGRVSKEKGVSELIETFLDADLDNIILKIIGDGPILSDLKQKYHLSNIEFYGQRSNKEVLEIIKESKAVVTATKLYEGQPTLLCEASTLGVPSIFPKSGGISDFFPKNYRFSFEHLEYGGLKKKLKLLQDEKIRLTQGRENKNYIEKYLSEKTLIERFEKILNE
jgi:glycosyltransferase involved in cell wall biosynthesis